MKVGICKLCLEERELLNKSHIIPDFMYKTLYDERHRIIRFEPKKLLKEQLPLKYMQSGIYEGGILCERCDNEVIQKYESYASKILYTTGILPKEIKPNCQNYIDEKGFRFSICKNIDYSLLKLFLLSILWRSSISKHPIFKEINLGKNEDIIRDMIFSGNAKHESDFPITIFSFLKDKDASKDFVIQPRDAGRRLLFPIRGIIYNFYLSIDDVKDVVRDNILKENGTMTLFHFKTGTFRKFIEKYFFG